jgi:hypothetical protein
MVVEASVLNGRDEERAMNVASRWRHGGGVAVDGRNGGEASWRDGAWRWRLRHDGVGTRDESYDTSSWPLI